MRILGIETSCDETALCIIEAGGPLAGADIKILANVTLSQAQLHAPFGGVFPSLAKREHLKNLPVLLKQVLAEAQVSEAKQTTDAIAVTYGPGLEPCLWAGISFAQTLAKKWGVLLVPVNHMEGHIFSALLHKKDTAQCYTLNALRFPALALLISGGHTELDLMEDYGKYRLIGETRDDAVGEAFDKVARLLGLHYPGGPEISRLAESARTSARAFRKTFPPIQSELNGHAPTPVFRNASPPFVLPRPMLHSNDLDFSFSGIKTAVLYLLKKISEETPDVRGSAAGGADWRETSGVCAEIAREFEDAVTEVLVAKTKRALRAYGAQTLVVAGGVIANAHIRRAMAKCANEEGVSLLIPEISHTTDNALMIAVASYATALNAVEGRMSLLPAPDSIRADGTAKISAIC